VLSRARRAPQGATHTAQWFGALLPTVCPSRDVTDPGLLTNSPIEADWSTTVLEPISPSAKLVGKEQHMMNCISNGWLMMAGGLLTYGVLALAGAALVKYLFFAGSSTPRV